MPFSLPFSSTKFFGERLMMILTCSSSASSSSHAEALKNWRGLRAMTFTSFAPRRRRRAAAVHGRVADTDDQHLLADGLDVLEGHRLEPGDADVDVGGAFGAAGQLEFLALGRAGADEHGIEAALGRAIPSCDLIG